MTSDFEHLRLRTKDFAIRTVKLVEALPTSMPGRRLGDQLLRAACSVGANYRAACRARSRNDFVAKLAIVEEEADECVYWLEIITEVGLMRETKTRELHKEAKELVAIVSASRITARKNGRST
ncbi:MAG: four helix bundle protein [Tepidisphaeraceae bacterium]